MYLVVGDRFAMQSVDLEVLAFNHHIVSSQLHINLLNPCSDEVVLLGLYRCSWNAPARTEPLALESLTGSGNNFI